MKKAYWNCEIQNNWAGALRDEMLSRNIFCYGKDKRANCEKVVKPFLRHAISHGNSVILVEGDPDVDYEEIIQLAENHGYETEEYEPRYHGALDTKHVLAEAFSLIKILTNEAHLLYVRKADLRKHEVSTLSTMLSLLEKPGEMVSTACGPKNISLAVEDSNWELLFPEKIGNSAYLNFCITASCARLNLAEMKANRKRSVIARTLFDKEIIPETKMIANLDAASRNQDYVAASQILNDHIQCGDYMRQLSPFENLDNREVLNSLAVSRMSAEFIDSYVEGTTEETLQRFFYYVQTVICTGLSDISPETNKAFLRNNVITYGMRTPGGKFLVTELCQSLQPIRNSVFPKTVLTSNGIPIEKLLATVFRAGWCVIERNGVAMTYAAHTGNIIPIVFRNCAKAMDWVELYFSQMGWGWPEPAEMDTCSVRYLLPTQNANGEPDEIIISYIHTEDISAYVDQATMVAMEVEEYLQKPELLAEIPNLDRRRDTANISLQKIVSHACMNYHRVRKVAQPELPVDEETKQTVVSMMEEYKWRPYQKTAVLEPVPEPETAVDILPKKRVLFLGGHANMVKKLRQIFTGWDFLTDDELGSWTGGDCEVIFFWTAHCSHLIQHYVDARKRKETPYLYVTATNIDRLITEMAQKYKSFLSKQRTAACLSTTHD